MENKPDTNDLVNPATMNDTADDIAGEMELEEIANLFIKMANDLVDTQKMGKIGRAMRLATSMFNSHEYATKSPDMETDRGDVTEWFASEYRSMLEYHIDLQKSMRQNQSSGCS